MNLCEKCFSEITPDALYCKECGAPVSSNEGAEISDAEVYPEITRANLFRLRGDYDDAEKVCVSILRKFPNNITAHVLLGDIYNDKDDQQQALQWYEIAQDLSPENTSLQQKIVQTKKRLKAKQVTESTSGLEVKAESKFPLIFVSLTVVLVVALSGIAYYLGTQRAKNSESAGVAVFARPIEINNSTQNDSEATPPVNPISENSSVQQKQESVVSMTNEESELLKLINSWLTDSRYRASHVEINWRNRSVRVTMSGQPASPEYDDVAIANSAMIVLSVFSETDAVSVRVIESNSQLLRSGGIVSRESLGSSRLEVGTPAWAREVILERL